MLIVRCLLGLLLVLAATTLVSATETKTFTYKQIEQGELKLIAYLPDDWKAGEKYPAIVFFFGGGWNNGNIKQFEKQSRHLAQRGMVAICADYRVKSRQGVTPEACVEDAKSAIRWVRKNAASLAIDPDKVVAAGGSAGGHIAACTALAPGLDAKDEDAAISSRPNLLVLFNPVLNFNVDTLTSRIGNDEKLAKAISPTQHLAQDTPATLLFYGKDDRLLAQGNEFIERSKQLSHKAEIFLAEGVGHGFFNRAPWQEKTIERMDEFLVAQGYLKPVGAAEK